MLLRVDPIRTFSGTFRIPSSKPETQRAILTASIADGTSRVFNDLRCDETETMKKACRMLGAEIVERDDHLEIRGFGRAPRYSNSVIDAAGSGLVFRTMTALSCAFPSPVVITGDATLRNRVMAPLFEALRELGANIQSICQDGKAPIVNWGRALEGGLCRLPGNVSSQFITAILLAAPFARRPVEIEVVGEVYSKSYIRQTLSSMSRAGVPVAAAADYRRFRVEPAVYRAHDSYITEDYTSASYLLATAALYRGRCVFTNMHGGSEQGERAIVDILRRLGLHTEFDRDKQTLSVDNPDGVLRGDFEIDVTDCPNIVPTLAAIGCYVDGTFRVVGGRITRFHKASRIEAMVKELAAAGVDIEPLYDRDVCDGFEVRGAASYPGAQKFSSWGDHRIFMSLFVASLRMRAPCFFSGFDDVRLSFPEFFTEFAKAGVTAAVVDDAEEETDRGARAVA
jgi:3-phosphoshikimate 1-carboxyvinyltransferase